MIVTLEIVHWFEKKRPIYLEIDRISANQVPDLPLGRVESSRHARHLERTL